MNSTKSQLDAEAIYYLLEHDILPLYYEHGGQELFGKSGSSISRTQSHKSLPILP